MRQLLYDVLHSTTYNYLGKVSVSHHLLKLAPRHYFKQNCQTHELAVNPTPATLSLHSDYFGNPTHFISIERPHEQLVVSSRSRVAVSPAFIPEAAETASWENVRAQCRDDHSGQALEAHEFTGASPMIPINPAFADYASASFTKNCPLLNALADLARRIQADFKFDPSATTVTTSVADFFRLRRGVCQDFAHFQIACLRSIGLPARYVSGYIETDPPSGQPKLRGVDASHAWTSLLCPGIGWIDADPTNNCFPSLRHITIGWGRDYGDVCPIRGALVGGHHQTLHVSVDVSVIGSIDTDSPGPVLI